MLTREILKLVNDFTQWRGNSYTLASMSSELTKLRIIEAIEETHPEVTEIIRGL